MLLGTLGARLLGNLLTGKDAFHAVKGVNKKGKGIHEKVSKTFISKLDDLRKIN